MSRKRKQLRLQDIFRGRLPERTLEAIEKMDLSISEVAEWEESKSPVRISLEDGYLHISTRVRIRITKRLVVLVIAIFGSLWLLYRFAPQDPGLWLQFFTNVIGALL